MKHFQLVAFLSALGVFNSCGDNRCGCSAELIPLLKHSIACLTHTRLQYCVCADTCSDTEGTAYPAFNAEQTSQQKTAE